MLAPRISVSHCWAEWKKIKYEVVNPVSKFHDVFNQISIRGLSQVPNRMNLVVDRPQRHELNRYRQARAHEALYRAAARLWAQGVEIGKAINIVETAMKDAGEL